MPMQFTCPACSNVLNAPDTAAGITAPCPKCGVRITAPLASGQMATLAAPAAGLGPQGPTPPGVAPRDPDLAPLGGAPGGTPPATGPEPAYTPPSPSYSPGYAAAGGAVDLSGLSWGAFFLNWIWGIAHGVWISLLCFVPCVGAVMPFVLLFKGNEWAWQNRTFSGAEEFRQVQRAWAMWGLIIFGLQILLGLAYFLFAMNAMRSAMPTGMPGGLPGGMSPTR